MPHQCTNCGHTFPDGSKEMLSGCPDCGGNKFQFSPARSGLDRSSTSDSGDRSGERGSGGAAGDASGSADGAVARAANTVRNLVSDETRGVEDGSAVDAAGESEVSTPGRDADDRASDSDSAEFDEWPETAREPDERADSSEPSTESTPGSERGEDSAPASEELDWADADEDSAQASARTDVVSPEELPPASNSPAERDEDVPEHGRVVSEPTGERPSLEELREELNDQFESIKIVQPGRYELNLMELYDREEYIVSLEEDGRYVIDVPDSWRESDD